MTTRTRGYLLGVCLAIVGAWTGLQFWLAHRAFAVGNAHAHAAAAAFRLDHPSVSFTTTYVPASYWLKQGIVSLVAFGLIGLVAAALAVGARRWWTLLVAALPAAVAVGRFADGTSIGQGWNQPTAAVQTWLGVGVAVDTATLLAVATLLVLALPSRPTAAVAPTLFRASPAAVVLVGWWLTRHPVADASDRVWLAQAVVWVVVVALLAASSLPMGFRLIAIAGVMPLLSFTILNDLVGSDGRGFDGVRYLHHLAVAIGVTAYVVAVPKLLRRLRAQPVLAPSAR